MSEPAVTGGFQKLAGSCYVQICPTLQHDIVIYRCVLAVLEMWPMGHELDILVKPYDYPAPSEKHLTTEAVTI